MSALLITDASEVRAYFRNVFLSVQGDEAMRLYDLLPPIAQDQKTVAERKWRESAKPPKPQKPCDIGLFSDDAAQLDLCEMFQQPTNEE